MKNEYLSSREYRKQNYFLSSESRGLTTRKYIYIQAYRIMPVWSICLVCLVCLSRLSVDLICLSSYSCTLCQEDSQRFLWSTKIWIEKNSVKISLLPLLKILLLLFSSFLDFFLLLLLLPSLSFPFSFLSLLFLLPSLAKTDWRTERHKQKDKGYDKVLTDIQRNWVIDTISCWLWTGG